MPFIGPWEIAIFILFLLIVMAWWASRRKPKQQQPQATVVPQAPQQPIIIQQPSQTSEKIVIKEVVMIPCKYCGALTPQTDLYCSNCGAPRR